MFRLGSTTQPDSLHLHTMGLRETPASPHTKRMGVLAAQLVPTSQPSQTTMVSERPLSRSPPSPLGGSFGLRIRRKIWTLTCFRMMRTHCCTCLYSFFCTNNVLTSSGPIVNGCREVAHTRDLITAIPLPAGLNSGRTLVGTPASTPGAGAVSPHVRRKTRALRQQGTTGVLVTGWAAVHEHFFIRIERTLRPQGTWAKQLLRHPMRVLWMFRRARSAFVGI